MKNKKPTKSVWIVILLVLAMITSVYINLSGQRNGDGDSKRIIALFKELNKSTDWRLADTVRLNFRTYHPQGMVKIGDSYFLSSVEQIEPTERIDDPHNDYDRTPGRGIGHLFHFNQAGDLISQTVLGEGDIYHPGGIDYDGKLLWVPVAEYRPNSRSIIYGVDPITLESFEVFRFDDHIGGIVYNKAGGTLCGVSWGSRRFYTWTLDSGNGPPDLSAIPRYEMKLNGNHYVDYQDCHYLTDQFMICSGLNQYAIADVGTIAFGGLDLVDLRTLIAVHQIPVINRIKPDLVMNNNPFFIELHNDHLRFYFVPEDDESVLYLFDAIHME